MSNVSVNPPRTPVTEGTNGVAAATLPNVCKMPGPPAPFVPTPLPNVGKSGTDPKKYSKSVTIGGKKVAIRGATFGSMGDVASKGTGGGLVSSNVEGPTSFVGPGSMDVKIEGKNVQLLGDPMLNNCGPGGSPANAATMMGVFQKNGDLIVVTGQDSCPLCKKTHGSTVKLKETPVTKADAAQLAKKLFKRVNEENLVPWAKMLGVAHCKCGQKYADHSGATRGVFRRSVDDLEGNWLAPEVGTSEESTRKFTDAFPKKYKTNVGKVWVRANTLHEKWFADKKSLPAAFPPGTCAGPKALVFAMGHGAQVTGLTERWFDSGGEPADGKIKFRDSDGQELERQFAHGKSVPPCGSCNLILPMILCPEAQEVKCLHKNKK